LSVQWIFNRQGTGFFDWPQVNCAQYFRCPVICFENGMNATLARELFVVTQQHENPQTRI